MGAIETPALVRTAAGGDTAARRQTHIPELLEIHADELAYLWGQRRGALFDERYTLASFLELNERIEAHVAGLLTVPAALPGLLGKRLQAASDRDDAFAAACGLLRLRNPAVSARVVEVFAHAQGPRLLGLRDALGMCSLSGAAPAVQAVQSQGHPQRAVAAAAVLAQRGQLEPLDPHLSRLLLDADDQVAAQAWRVLTLLDASLAASPEGPPPRPYKPALLRQTPSLRRAVLGCAVWSGLPWALKGLRILVGEGDVEALGWLAAVGRPEDDVLVHQAMEQLLPPLDQAALLGRTGRPAGIETLCRWMRGSDMPLAAAAMQAYMRITGEDLRGSRTTPPPREGADEFERDMAAPIWLPDLVRLQAHQDACGQALQNGQRWNRGRELGECPSTETLARIDLPARWDACARAALARQPVAAPPPAL
jgi:hypothetical protein